MSFSNGDKCLVICDGRTVPGEVEMMSANQISAFIKFEAILAGHAGTMPIMARASTDAARGIYRSIINGAEVVLRKP